MKNLVLLGVVLLSSGLAAQRAVTEDKPLAFAEAIKKAESSYAAGNYGVCVNALQQALMDAMKQRRVVVLAALPPAPEGFKEDPQREPKATGMVMGGLVGLASIAGQQIAKTYRGDKGAQIKITVMADSAMGGMAAMMFNPAIIQADPKSQLFEYDGGHKAVVKVNGDRVSVNALLSGKHLIQLEGRKISSEQAMELLSQQRMDKIAKALGR